VVISGLNTYCLYDAASSSVLYCQQCSVLPNVPSAKLNEVVHIRSLHAGSHFTLLECLWSAQAMLALSHDKQKLCLRGSAATVAISNEVEPHSFLHAA